VASPTVAPASAPNDSVSARERSRRLLLWYRLVQKVVSQVLFVTCGLRASGRNHIPETGGVLLVSNHLSHLDVFVLGLPLTRPLNYVARSTLFLPILGAFIRSVGGFPIQREGMGASGLKETLKRLRAGGIVTLFPEGTRSADGELAELKSGIAVLASRARVPIVPAAIAGTFEAWPRSRKFPRSHPIWVHYGPAIQPEELGGLNSDAVVVLLRDRMTAALIEARRKLARITS
jgi:1-acyl-sn-glycerol-3-phosphate acyltransferase